MNYNSIQDIWDSGVDNMTVVVNGVKHDDDSVQVTPPSWLRFNNTSVSTLYCNGNSYIGVGSSTENIKMNRRDAAMYYLYTEEGTILNTYRFFRVRWNGYSAYNSTDSSAIIKWEVIFFDDGDIQLHFRTIPTIYTDGINSLIADKTYIFNMSSETPDISFKYNSSNNTFEQSYGVLVKLPAFKYLIRDNTTIYTIQDGSLVNLGTVLVDSSLFETSGFDSVDKDILLSFSTPELLTYNIVSNKTSLVARGVPLPKTLVVKIDNLSGVNGFGIKSILADFNGAIKLAISLNNGSNYYKFFEDSWVLCSSDDDGMLLSDAISLEREDWYEICQTNLSCYLKLIFSSLSQSLKRLDIEI